MTCKNGSQFQRKQKAWWNDKVEPTILTTAYHKPVRAKKSGTDEIRSDGKKCGYNFLHRSGRDGENLFSHGYGLCCPANQESEQNCLGKAGGRSRRKPGIST